MKLVVAIMSNKDVTRVIDNTGKEGFSSTRISTSGQFLNDGQTTIIFGVEEERLEELFNILKNSVTKRTIRQKGVKSTVVGSLLKEPMDIEEYGVVSFVLDVDDFRKF